MQICAGVQDGLSSCLEGMFFVKDKSRLSVVCQVHVVSRSLATFRIKAARQLDRGSNEVAAVEVTGSCSFLHNRPTIFLHPSRSERPVCLLPCRRILFPTSRMSALEIAALESEVKEYKLQLETVELSLQNDPDNSELQSLKEELEEVISLTASAIAELKPQPVPVAAAKPSVPLAKEKWSKENHPAYQAGYRKPEVDADDSTTSAQLAVNDTVSARWKSGDGGFYTARITSITGSSSDPVYIVTFKNYGNTETLKSKDVKPLFSDVKKRKADGISGSSTPVPPPSNPNVISAAASVDPTLAQQARREPGKVSDGSSRPAKIPRKVKANKELEAGKNSWQDFAAKGKTGKTGKKDSMFRTGTSANARGKARPCLFMDVLLTSAQLASLVAAMKCERIQQDRGTFTSRGTRMIEADAWPFNISATSIFCFERFVA